ncbi:MAG: hypothetical protein ACE5KM_19760, partial [Planctomycetaceae bacterium]
GLAKGPVSSPNGEKDEIAGELILGWLEADAGTIDEGAAGMGFALPGSSGPEPDPDAEVDPEDDGRFDGMVSALDESGELMMDPGPNNEGPN